jgi:L-iditol 2-dehydrogenase
LKAVVKYDHGPGKMEVREMPEPEPSPDEVILKVGAAGICGTDLHIQEGTWPVNPPVIVGHEFTGTIFRLGSDVAGWEIGQRVVPETHARFCGKCDYCISGKYNLCDKRMAFGYGVNGAFTRLVAVPSRILHRLPDNVSFEHAAIVEPLADVCHSVLTIGNVKPGDSVLIVGPGPVGLLATQVAKANGATSILITGLSKDAERLKIAERLGATPIDVEKQNAVKAVLAATGDRGVDFVLEASGTSSGVAMALNAVRKNGQIVLMGVHSRESQVDLNRIVLRETRVSGTFVNIRDDWERALRLVSTGLVDLKPLLSGTFRLDQWERAFDLCRKGEAIKALLVPE